MARFELKLKQLLSSHPLAGQCVYICVYGLSQSGGPTKTGGFRVVSL